MGTVVSIDVRSELSARWAIDCVVASLHRADETFSTYRDDSFVRRLDRAEVSLEDATDEVRTVLATCERLRAETGGAFDHRFRGTLDPSAYVKGWAAQRAVDELAAEGFHDACVTAGGDVAARGHPGEGIPWRVGVQHPRDRLALAATVAATDLAVATSGAYERGDHVIAPGTGRPPKGVLSVTVTGPDLGRADAYSTAAFALGPLAARWTTRLPQGYEAMTITDDDQVWSTPDFPFAEPER